MRKLDPHTAEWLVLNTFPGGLFVQHPEGEQQHSIQSAQQGAHRYTLSQAQALAARLGAPWKVNHFHTLVPPAEHEAWLNGRGATWAP